MPYFYPLSRCQRCNQIFFSRPKINYLIHSRLRLRVYTRPRVSRTSSKRGSLAVEQNIDDGEGEEGRGEGVKPPRRALLYTQNITDRHNYQAKRPLRPVHPPPPSQCRSRSKLASLVPATIPGGLCGLKPPTSAESKSSFQ